MTVAHKVQHLSLLIKPASSNCNLRCGYCFYNDIADKRTTSTFGMMTEQTLEKLVIKAMEAAGESCTFAFQGGEPTIIGLGYYRQLVELAGRYNIKKIKVNYTLQTNGLLINEEWADFLYKNKFLIGLSLDGPRNIHDAMRLDPSGKGTFNRVMDTVALFNKHKVEYNILCVVNVWVARHVNQVYSFYKKNHFKYLQFIPCLDPLGENPGGYAYSLSPERFTHFLKTLFDEWYRDFINGSKVSIRYFDNLIGMLLGYPPESCGMSGICTAYLVIEADGGVYPCDYYVLDNWYLGNINTLNFAEIHNNNVAKHFVQVSEHVSPECRSCKWYGLCRGGCRRNREPFENGKPALNYYCKSYREFFEYAVERLIYIVKTISQ